MDFTEMIIETKEVYKGDFLVIENLKVKLPDGNVGRRDVVRHPGAVAILAFIDKETILLVEQFRIALNKTMLEIPAGKLEKGEIPLECAHRELEEETGYKAGKIEYLGTIATGAGFTDEIIHIYKASELFKGIKGGDEDEFIEVTKYKIQEVEAMIKSGEIIDAKTISSLMYI
ncbi:NUDIX hydrolase [Clostridium vincentii]|uniref:ADP-ribose pyrophosphatase n=1 Tax=Clostridium vincentii TaxID=52704 RepID=A0A2T0BAH2_9CLOT|nr:NUDIX hydrolase [Clostridium vincentii]PRR80888.1 ADP-ribose pyrophosphatase [Clostridium vincentii]